MLEFLEMLGDIVWGPITLTLLVGTGLFLTYRLRGLQFRKLVFAHKLMFTKDENSEGDISHFQALTTALAATIGTGNIAGVATAIFLGGPGAVFWMWVTGLVGMATKYAEAILAVKYRVKNDAGEMSGGPMYYIERGLGWKWLGMLFAFFAAIAAFGIGNMVQSNSVASAVKLTFNIDPVYTGIILAALTAVVIIGGIKSIGRVTAYLVPFMAFFYFVGGLIVLFINFEAIPQAFADIFTYAFSSEAVGGGIVGAAIRYGVARGVFSNEAGLGSAPIAAAAAKTDYPGRQALVSMTQTFIDTIVVCTVTALAILTSGALASGQTGAALTSTAFNMALGNTGSLIVTTGLILFAYSTVLGWSYYGEKSLEYLVGSKATIYYRWLFVVAVAVGAIVELDLVWALADVMNGLMAIPNLIGLLGLSGVVVAETNRFLKAVDEGKTLQG